MNSTTAPPTTAEIVSEAIYEMDLLTTETLASQMLLGTRSPEQVFEQLCEYVKRHPEHPIRYRPSKQVEAPE